MVPRHDLTDKRRPQADVHSGPRPAGPPTQRSVRQRTTAEVLARYLNAHSAEMLRSLRLYDENAGSAETAAEAAEAVRLLRRSARRLVGTLQTFRPLLDTAWADRLTAELWWLSGVLAKEHEYAARLNLLLAALHRLSTPPTVSLGEAEGEESRTGRPGVGAAKAGALLDRQLTLARTRAHSAALRALGSGRFHAVADEIAVLASEAPVDERAAERSASLALRPLAELTHRRLVEAVEALPYGPEALAHTLTGTEGRHDAAWNQVRQLARQTRYALEVLDGVHDDGGDPSEENADSPTPETGAGTASGAGAGAASGSGSGTASPLHGALTLVGHQLNRHRDAAEAAAAAAAAGRTPRIAPATAYALGVLHADQRHEVEAARLAFCRIWPPRGELSRKGQPMSGPAEATSTDPAEPGVASGPSASSGPATIRAAGCVLWRRCTATPPGVPAPADGLEIALVHRPRYDDWSLPKGKLKRGESERDAAVREVQEETGVRCVLGPALPTARYLVNGQPKVVSYWAAEALDGTFEPNDEVDRVLWLPPDEARTHLTHPRDADLVTQALEALGRMR